MAIKNQELFFLLAKSRKECHKFDKIENKNFIVKGREIRNEFIFSNN